MDKGLAAATINVVCERNPKMNAGLASNPSAFVNDGEVRIVKPEEYKEAALALAEAFEHDHTTDYFVNTPDRTHWTKEQKWDLHVSMMEYITYAHCLKGLVTTVGPNYGSVALWMPPGNNMDDYLTTIRSGLWRLSYKLSREGKARFFNEFLPLLTATKTAVLGAHDDASWYLVYIGTRVAARGNGYARKLITHVTDMADEGGLPCYLESSDEINVKIYGKMGFEVKRKVYLQREKDLVTLDIMVREAKERKNSFAEKTKEVRTEKVL